MYSTCSLSKKENQNVCERFLNEHKTFKINCMTTIQPTNASDGFFFAEFIKE